MSTFSTTIFKRACQSLRASLLYGTKYFYKVVWQHAQGVVDSLASDHSTANLPRESASKRTQTAFSIKVGKTYSMCHLTPQPKSEFIYKFTVEHTLELRPYGAIQNCLLLLLFFKPRYSIPREWKNYSIQYRKVQKSSWNEPYSFSFTKQSWSKMALYRWIRTESR